MNIAKPLTQAEPTDPVGSAPGISHHMNAIRSRLATQVRSFFCDRHTLRRFTHRLLPVYEGDTRVGGLGALLSLFGKLTARH